MKNDSVATMVVEACLKAGIREYVVCAGARNMSLIDALVSSDDAIIWSHFEERSAGFFALGRSMDSREPCAVVTTSGTAVAELLPAVIEAHYQGRPLVLISADRPASFRGSGAPQAIEQPGIFSQYVEACDDVTSVEDVLFENWAGLRPWHLNVCLEEDEVVRPVLQKIEEFQPLRSNFDVTDLVHFFQDHWKGFVVAVGGLEPEDREEVFGFLKEIKVPVIADATSGLRELLGPYLVADAEQVMREFKPQCVLRLGEVPVGRFWRDLENTPEVRVFSVTRSGFSGLARESAVLHGEVGRILRGLGEVGELGDTQDILVANRRRWSQTQDLLDAYPDSEPAMMRTLSIYATTAQSLYLGNSLPIREWGQFAQRDYPIETVRANRGANGIDGQLSTWIGMTHGLDDSWCVLGDLTTLYDMSAPFLLDGCEASGRVLVIVNNSGGKIFERMPRVKQMAPLTRELVLNHHQYPFEKWAEMWGYDYAVFKNADEIEIESSERVQVVEIVPSQEQTEAFWKAYASL